MTANVRALGGTSDPSPPSLQAWTTSTTNIPDLTTVNKKTNALTAPETKTRVEVLVTAALWVVIALIHGACGAYYAFAAVLYHELPGLLLGSHMRAFHLVIDMKYTPTIAGFFALCAALHTAFMLEMIVMSACRRTLVFRSQYSIDPRALMRSAKHLHKAVSTRVFAFTNGAVVPSESRNARDLLRRASGATSSAWQASFGVTGVFGVGGKHFAVLFLAREVLEAALQSSQAYNVSRYVSRVWLNRSAVVLVAVSCWSTPTIRLLTTRSRRAELLMCLFVDVVLDVASSVGVPLALGLMYGPDYDPVQTTFQRPKWRNNAWVANLNSEFKQIFIQSWFDFASRALFATVTLLSLDDVKLLAAPPADIARSFSKLAPVSVRSNGKRLERFVHALLVSWGIVIVALYISSHSGKNSAELNGCMVRVHPWLASTPTCVALEIDCHLYAGMTGAASQLESRWSGLDPNALSLIVVRNCPELYIPASIQSFPALAGVYIYTSSLKEWSAEAALTKHHHPNMRQITFVTVDMTAACSSTSGGNSPNNRSSLPPGLLSRDFPPTLGVALFAGVALDNLPSNLHELWPRGLNLLMMRSNLTEVPDVLLHLEPAAMNLQSNCIQRLSPAVFELPSLQWLELGGNPLDELPENVRPSQSLVGLEIVNTKVTVLPAWMKTESFRSRVVVTAAGTPFCAHPKNDTSVPLAIVQQYCKSTAA